MGVESRRISILEYPDPHSVTEEENFEAKTLDCQNNLIILYNISAPLDGFY